MPGEREQEEDGIKAIKRGEREVQTESLIVIKRWHRYRRRVGLRGRDCKEESEEKRRRGRDRERRGRRGGAGSCTEDRESPCGL